MTLTGCEQALERDRTRTLVIVGASFTAGVGPGSPGRSWANVLARKLHWNAVVYGVAGAGYVRAGAGRLGPVAAEIERLDLPAVGPALVIVQAGHDDIGVSAQLERQRVARAIALIHAEAPKARIALLTVFPGRSPASAARKTDKAIVAAAATVDRGVIVMDPLAAGWRYQRSPDGLHPTSAGSEWLASKVAGILRAHGVLPRASAAAPTVCSYSRGYPAGSRAYPAGSRAYPAGSRAYPAGSRSRISVPPPAADSARIVPP